MPSLGLCYNKRADLIILNLVGTLLASLLYIIYLCRYPIILYSLYLELDVLFMIKIIIFYSLCLPKQNIGTYTIKIFIIKLNIQIYIACTQTYPMII